MMRATTRVILWAAFCGIIAWGTAAGAEAHETWLLPSTFAPDVGQSVDFSLTSGMAFARSETAIAPERVVHASFRLNGRQSALSTPERNETALVFRSSFDSAGIVAAQVTLGPRPIELTDEQVEEYFDEINPAADVRSAWSKLQGQVAWTETYTKHAKTLVAVGNVGEDDSWQRPLGAVLEIVPVSHPFQPSDEGTRTFRLLRDGRPLADHSLGLMVDGQPDRQFALTDDEGQATFRLTTGQQLLVFAVDLRLGPDGKSWTSDFATLTVGVALP